eukprot:5609040-Pyramimonas_sp.AAC.1
MVTGIVCRRAQEDDPGHERIVKPLLDHDIECKPSYDYIGGLGWNHEGIVVLEKQRGNLPT